MNVENKQKLIDVVNSKSAPWKGWSWGECFIAMIEEITDEHADRDGWASVMAFLEITPSQAHNLVYMGSSSINRFADMGLDRQKSVLIKALNSITDETSTVQWDIPAVT